MVEFVDIDPKDVDTTRAGRRGRVAYPILKAFLERNVKMSKLDLSDTNYALGSLRANLAYYTSRHDMPVKVFTAGGEIHLMRLDIDEKGKPIKDWETGGEKPKPLASENVKKRSKKEGAWKDV